ncbi:MAG: tetratricopeptide repeat protein [Candidatus Omnitrophica bacterium]|nr:tetratricopeptide repeat protein [Candidatus Omnitrophota bacterium]
MKFRVSILLAAAWLALATLAWGADDNLRRQFQPALKSMELNRYLIARLEKEHAELVSLASSDPSPALKTKAENYALMVRSLKEDQEKLMASLPETLRIEEFAKDIAQKKAAAKFPKIASRLALRSAPTISQRHETALKLFEQNRYDEAAAAYEGIILQNPNDDEAYVLLGHVLLLSGQYEKAGRAFQMAEDIDPGNRTNILSFYEDFSLQDPEDDARTRRPWRAWGSFPIKPARTRQLLPKPLF